MSYTFYTPPKPEIKLTSEISRRLDKFLPKTPTEIAHEEYQKVLKAHKRFAREYMKRIKSEI